MAKSVVMGSLLAAFSCSMPTYDPSISAGAAFYSKLGTPFQIIGPLDIDGGDIDDYEFRPLKSIAPNMGFLLKRDSDFMHICFVDYSAGSWFRNGFLSAKQSLGEYAIASVGANNATSILLPDQSYPTTGLTIYDYMGGGSLSANLTVNGSTAPQSFDVSLVLAAGGTLYREPAPPHTSKEKFTMIFLDTAGMTRATIGDHNPLLGNYDPTIPPAGNSKSLSTANLNSADIGTAFPEISAGNPVGIYYCGSNNIIKHFDWMNPGNPPSTFAVSEPLVGVLADGRLICQGKYYLTVYTGNWTKLFSRPAGSVRFIHEVEDLTSGTPYLIFSQVFPAPQAPNQKDQCLIYLWRVKSSELTSLAP